MNRIEQHWQEKIKELKVAANIGLIGNINSVKIEKKDNFVTADVQILPEFINKVTLEAKKKLERRVNKFIVTLSEKCKNANLDQFYSNFKTAQFELSTPKEAKKLNKKWNGTYDIFFNKITLYTFKSVYHELMHMASTRREGNIVYCGFRKHDLYTGQSVAFYFNEGYTQLLKNRYFGKSLIYEPQVLLATFIEEVVGKEKMETLYFKADFDGLIDELKKYESEETIIKFFYAIDGVSTKGTLNDEEYREVCHDWLEDIYNFINDCRKKQEKIEDDNYSFYGK